METAGAGGIRIGASNGPITFYNTGSVETARLDNTGSLSLGFTSSLGHKLNVSGSGRLVNGLYMNNSAGGADVRLVAGGGVYDAFTFAGNNYAGTYTVEVSYANSFTRFSNSYNNFQFAGDVGISNKNLYISDGSGITKTLIGPGSLSLTGSASITGSVNITSVLNLAPSNPLPTGTTGSLATSGSSLYFHDGTNWRQVSLL
jgi:hypothetical protein